MSKFSDFYTKYVESKKQPTESKSSSSSSTRPKRNRNRTRSRASTSVGSPSTKGLSIISRSVDNDKYDYNTNVDRVSGYSYRDFLKGKAKESGIDVDNDASDSQVASQIAKSKMKRLNETYKPQTQYGRMMMGGKEGREKFNTLISKINNRINEPTAPDMERIHSPFTRAAESMAKSLGVNTDQRKSNAKTVRSVTKKMKKPPKSYNFRRMGSQLLN